jgi:hypothetical protein
VAETNSIVIVTPSSIYLPMKQTAVQQDVKNPINSITANASRTYIPKNEPSSSKEKDFAFDV